MMVLRRTSYPQVEPRAAGVMTRAVAVVPRTLAIGKAAQVARQRGLRLVLARVGSAWAGATPETLSQAMALGLEAVPLDAVLWGAPAVSAGAAEVVARRRLGPAAPFVVVVEDHRPVGAIVREPEAPSALPRSAAAALGRLDPGTASLLRRAAGLGAELGWPVAVVGGFARDLLGGRLEGGRRDLDLVVEGDGRLFARRLGAQVGAAVREHPAFRTATVRLADGAEPPSTPRTSKTPTTPITPVTPVTPVTIDVATARRERYPHPGALPVVAPASLGDDLARRDFSVNALAIRLDGTAWGQVLDPEGGLADLEERHVRILHPLSFIEDPTRVFRAVRFAARLGFTLEPTTRRLLRAATARPVYPALSGDRLMAELDAILAEAAPADVLVSLGRAGAFRLGWPDYRFSARKATVLARVAAAVGTLPIAPETARGLYLLALIADLEAPAAEAWLARFGAPSPLRALLARARDEAPGLLARLGPAPRPAAAYATLRGVPEVVAAWAYVSTRSARGRARIAAHLAEWRDVRPLLTGDDLQAMGLPPGPRLGQLLGRLQAAQVAGRLRSREAAAAWVRRALAGPGATDGVTVGRKRPSTERGG
jgi:tRNA nucleotidyltransferase (CCA-adding enzyme)